MKRDHGFTLVELMITLIVMAIALSIAIPNLSGLGRETRMTSATNSIVTALNQARSEAVTRVDPVSVCASSDQATCAGNDEWAVGWISWLDEDGDGNVDGDEELLRVGDGVANMSITTGDAGPVTYTAEGSIDNASSITFTLEPDECEGESKREIDVNLSGRPRAEKVSC